MSKFNQIAVLYLFNREKYDIPLKNIKIRFINDTSNQ
jgi:hypothetical protein